MTETPIFVDQDTLSELINISGRQRMLSQRISLLILLCSQNKDKQLLQSLFDSIKLFESSYKKLTEGDKNASLPGLFSTRLKEIYDRNHANKIIQAFISDTKSLFNKLNNDEKIDEKTLNSLLVLSTTKLLTLLNDITSAYEAEAKISAERIQERINEKQHELATILHSISLVSKKANQISVYTHVVATRLGQTQSEAQPEGREDLETVASEIESLSEGMSKLIKELVAKVRE